MKKITRLFVLGLIMTMTVSCQTQNGNNSGADTEISENSTDNSSNKYKGPYSITLSRQTMKIRLGATKQLFAITEPEGVEVEWSVDKAGQDKDGNAVRGSDIVSIDQNGNVTALAIGKTTVYAENMYLEPHPCQIEVIDEDSGSIGGGGIKREAFSLFSDDDSLTNKDFTYEYEAIDPDGHLYRSNRYAIYDVVFHVGQQFSIKSTTKGSILDKLYVQDGDDNFSVDENSVVTVKRTGIFNLYFEESYNEKTEAMGMLMTYDVQEIIVRPTEDAPTYGYALVVNNFQLYKLITSGSDSYLTYLYLQNGDVVSLYDADNNESKSIELANEASYPYVTEVNKQLVVQEDAYYKVTYANNKFLFDRLSYPISINKNHDSDVVHVSISNKDVTSAVEGELIKITFDNSVSQYEEVKAIVNGTVICFEESDNQYVATFVMPKEAVTIDFITKVESSTASYVVNDDNPNGLTITASSPNASYVVSNLVLTNGDKVYFNVDGEKVKISSSIDFEVNDDVLTIVNPGYYSFVISLDAYRVNPTLTYTRNTLEPNYRLYVNGANVNFAQELNLNVGDKIKVNDIANKIDKVDFSIVPNDNFELLDSELEVVNAGKYSFTFENGLLNINQDGEIVRPSGAPTTGYALVIDNKEYETFHIYNSELRVIIDLEKNNQLTLYSAANNQNIEFKISDDPNVEQVDSVLINEQGRYVVTYSQTSKLLSLEQIPAYDITVNKNHESDALLVKSNNVNITAGYENDLINIIYDNSVTQYDEIKARVNGTIVNFEQDGDIFTASFVMPNKEVNIDFISKVESGTANYVLNGGSPVDINITASYPNASYVVRDLVLNKGDDIYFNIDGEVVPVETSGDYVVENGIINILTTGKYTFTISLDTYRVNPTLSHERVDLDPEYRLYVNDGTANFGKEMSLQVDDKIKVSDIANEVGVVEIETSENVSFSFEDNILTVIKAGDYSFTFDGHFLTINESGEIVRPIGAPSTGYALVVNGNEYYSIDGSLIVDTHENDTFAIYSANDNANIDLTFDYGTLSFDEETKQIKVLEESYYTFTFDEELNKLSVHNTYDIIIDISSTIELGINDTYPLYSAITRTPNESMVSYSTSDDAVAIVVDGVIVPQGYGDCIITATVGDKSDTVNVSVVIEDYIEPGSVTSYILSAYKTSYSIDEGNNTTLSVSISPSLPSGDKINWAICNSTGTPLDSSSIISIEPQTNSKNLVVNGLSTGTAYVKAYYGESQVIFTVEVKEVIDTTPVTYSININGNVFSMDISSDTSSQTVFIYEKQLNSTSTKFRFINDKTSSIAVSNSSGTTSKITFEDNIFGVAAAGYFIFTVTYNKNTGNATVLVSEGVNPNTQYNLTVASQNHSSDVVSFKVGGTTVTKAKAGETVNVIVDTDVTYKGYTLLVNDTPLSNFKLSSATRLTGSFVMPAGAVSVKLYTYVESNAAYYYINGGTGTKMNLTTATNPYYRITNVELDVNDTISFNIDGETVNIGAPSSSNYSVNNNIYTINTAGKYTFTITPDEYRVNFSTTVNRTNLAANYYVNVTHSGNTTSYAIANNITLHAGDTLTIKDEANHISKCTISSIGTTSDLTLSSSVVTVVNEGIYKFSFSSGTLSYTFEYIRPAGAPTTGYALVINGTTYKTISTSSSVTVDLNANDKVKFYTASNNTISAKNLQNSSTYFTYNSSTGLNVNQTDTYTFTLTSSGASIYLNVNKKADPSAEYTLSVGSMNHSTDNVVYKNTSGVTITKAKAGDTVILFITGQAYKKVSAVINGVTYSNPTKYSATEFGFSFVMSDQNTSADIYTKLSDTTLNYVINGTASGNQTMSSNKYTISNVALHVGDTIYFNVDGEKTDINAPSSSNYSVSNKTLTINVAGKYTFNITPDTFRVNFTTTISRVDLDPVYTIKIVSSVGGNRETSIANTVKLYEGDTFTINDTANNKTKVSLTMATNSYLTLSSGTFTVVEEGKYKFSISSGTIAFTQSYIRPEGAPESGFALVVNDTSFVNLSLSSSKYVASNVALAKNNTVKIYRASTNKIYTIYSVSGSTTGAVTLTDGAAKINVADNYSVSMTSSGNTYTVAFTGTSTSGGSTVTKTSWGSTATSVGYVLPRTTKVGNQVYYIEKKNLPTVAATGTSPTEVMIESLQGIVAQSGEARIFIVDTTDEYDHLMYLKSLKGFTVTKVTDPWTLVSTFKSYIQGSKYVYYDETNSTSYVNNATTISGINRWLVVHKNLVSKAESLGLTQGATGNQPFATFWNNYKSAINKKIVVNIYGKIDTMRDYAVANKALCVFLGGANGETDKQDEVRSYLAGSTMFGWGNYNDSVGESEINYVSRNSNHNIATIPSDHARNFSFYTGYSNKDANGTYITPQSNYKERTVSQIPTNKHYVAIVLSDGDNAQWTESSFMNDTRFYGSPYRTGDFPMTWGISPSFADLGESIVSELYGKASSRDQFICGPGGFGYTNIKNLSDSYLTTYAKNTAAYMSRIGLKYASFLDRGLSGNESSYLNKLSKFAAYSEIEGGLILDDDSMYISGNGSVYWSNNKPFVTAREVMWYGSDRKDQYGYTDRIADRINRYTVNPSSVAGYTVVLGHAWSIGSMPYINRLVHLLDSDVELVTFGEMVKLMKANLTNYSSKFVSNTETKTSSVSLTTNMIFKNEFNNLDLETLRDFYFKDEINLQDYGWVMRSGGLEYDHCEFVTSPKGSSDGGCILFDGSDNLGVAIADGLPNAYMYNKFKFTKGQKMKIIVGDSVDDGSNVIDVGIRIFVMFPDGTYETLTDGFSNGGLSKSTYTNCSSYYILNKNTSTFNWHEFTFSLTNSKYLNKEIIISIEQNDDGDGNGEKFYLRRVTFVDA